VEWQWGPDDFPILSLLRRYGRQTAVFLCLNWSNRLPDGFNALGYAGSLPAPLDIRQAVQLFYKALPNHKRSVLGAALEKTRPGAIDLEIDPPQMNED
jgi:hypothetical protein